MFFFNNYSRKIFRIDLLYRRLTAEQKALLLSFSEQEKDNEGTVNGSSQAKPGK